MNDDLTATAAAEAAAPLDATDQTLLDEIGTMLDVVDPVPTDLVERVRFALALDEVFEEVAAISRVPQDALAVRSDLAEAVRTETLTFTADRLTAMVTISPTGRGRVRVDGWVSPAGVRRVSLRMQGSDEGVRTDEGGRFAVDGIRSGFVQLVFHALESEAGGALVVTPLFKM
ncbi:MAG: hypothetical protein ACTHKG_09820 [Nocardioides sp.]